MTRYQPEEPQQETRVMATATSLPTDTVIVVAAAYPLTQVRSVKLRHRLWPGSRVTITFSLPPAPQTTGLRPVPFHLISLPEMVSSCG